MGTIEPEKDKVNKKEPDQIIASLIPGGTKEVTIGTRLLSEELGYLEVESILESTVLEEEGQDATMNICAVILIGDQKKPCFIPDVIVDFTVGRAYIDKEKMFFPPPEIPSNT